MLKDWDLFLAQLRQTLPYAAAARPVAEGGELTVQDLWAIVAASVSQSYLHGDGRDADWVKDPSLRAALFVQAYLSGTAEREAGGLYDLVHAIDVAYAMRYDEEFLKKGYNPSLLAFTAANHDTEEMSCKLGNPFGAAIALTVDRCWQGDAGWKPFILRDDLALTDRPGLRGFARLAEQFSRYGNPLAMSPLARRIRVYDKINLVERDADACRNGWLTLAQVTMRAMQAEQKFDLIMLARDMNELPDPLIARYVESAQVLRGAVSAAAAMANATAPGFLTPLEDRSPPERPQKRGDREPEASLPSAP